MEIIGLAHSQGGKEEGEEKSSKSPFRPSAGQI